MANWRSTLASNWQAATIGLIFVLTFLTFNVLFVATSRSQYFNEIIAALIGTVSGSLRRSSFSAVLSGTLACPSPVVSDTWPSSPCVGMLHG
jgi:TRAP-type uncharacterized transport system fused permease subunit